MTYPVSTAGYALTLKYRYAYGLLNLITDTSDSPNVALWAANTMDLRGQYTQETLGNGVVVNHAFDPYRGLLQSITAGAGGGTALQNNSYLYDPVGNLTQRQDNNAGTTESIYYDSLNRLSYTVGDTNTKMSYDSMDRLASWQASSSTPNVTNFTTPQSGCTYYTNAQPHAVRESTQGSWNTSFCYDANGNMTTQSSAGTVQRSFAWTSFNQPSAITAETTPSSYSDFYYDENHQRYEQIASYSGASESTEYIGGLMEKMANSTGTAYRYYIPAGNNFIVYNRWLSGTNAIDYATKDNIDSTAVVTDSKGALVVAEKFSALGWNENTSAQEATMASITRHEFTGQEGLDNYGLWMVDMNGRVYQPSGAYFYSPDPNIPDPQNTLDYNRYAYVDDNPLTFLDPTGFCGVTQNDDGTVSVDICAPPPIPDLCVGCFISSPTNWPGRPYKPYYPPAKPQPPKTDACSTPGVYVCQQPQQRIPCSAANSSGTGLLVQLAYTKAHSSFGITVPDASHTFVIVTDPSTGVSYASRGGPGSGPGGGAGLGWHQVVAVSGTYNTAFPDYGAVTAVQNVGYLNVPYSSAVSYMNSFAATTDSNNLNYDVYTQNSNSYSAALLSGLGLTAPTPAKNAPGFGSNPPSPQLECKP